MSTFRQHDKFPPDADLQPCYVQVLRLCDRHGNNVIVSFWRAGESFGVGSGGRESCPEWVLLLLGSVIACCGVVSFQQLADCTVAGGSWGRVGAGIVVVGCVSSGLLEGSIMVGSLELGGRGHSKGPGRQQGCC